MRKYKKCLLSISSIGFETHLLLHNVLQEEVHCICEQLQRLKDKNSRLGSKKFAVKLNDMYDCAVRTKDELSIDEDFSSVPSQERSTDDNSKPDTKNTLSAPKTSGSSTKRRIDAASTRSIVVDSEYGNTCSNNSTQKYANKGKDSGSSCLRRYIFRNTNFFGGKRNKRAPRETEDDVQMEPMPAHAIIFTVEEKSSYTQVSL